MAMKVSVRWLTARILIIVFTISVACILIQRTMLLQSQKSLLLFRPTVMKDTFTPRSIKQIQETLRHNDIKLGVMNQNQTVQYDTGQNQTTTPSPGDTMLQWRQYQKEALSVFILSAIGSNFTSKPGYKRELKLNGWEAMKHRFVSIKCCFLWNSNKYTYYTHPDKIYWKKSRLPATQFTCPIKGPFVDVKGVTLEFRKKRCPLDESLYIKPFIPKVQPKQSFAVCVKIVYGDVDVKLLIDWMEFYREMKADKIFMFTYNLTDSVDRVLEYYVRTGFLERRQFDFPWKKDGRMKREVGVKTPTVWQDEQVVVFDCYQRLYGYSYVAIVDLDEFLLPRIHKNIKEMMINLTGTYPKAAGFTFKSYIYAKDWGAKTLSGNGSDIVQYLRRTPALYTRQKNILIPGLIKPETIDTHEFIAIDGYERLTVPETIGAINHYRTCYSNLYKLCNKKNNQIFDNSILKIVDRIYNRTMLVNKITT